jgi:hypothetical protein
MKKLSTAKLIGNNPYLELEREMEERMTAE